MINFIPLLWMKIDQILEHIVILPYTRNTMIPGSELIKKFIVGSVIIVTVHNYFQTIGDSFSHHFLFMLSYVFSFKTYVFIDEGHVFFQKSDNFIGITHGYLNKYKEKHVLQSSGLLKFFSNAENYSVSSPQIHYIANKDGVEVFEIPQKILLNENESNIAFLNKQMIANLIEKNSLSENQDFEISQSFSNSKNLQNSYISDLFLSNEINVNISPEITYTNPYVICNGLHFENNQDRNVEILQKENLQILQKIFHFNLFVNFCTNLNSSTLCTDFRKQIAYFSYQHFRTLQTKKSKKNGEVSFFALFRLSFFFFVIRLESNKQQKRKKKVEIQNFEK